MRIWFAVSVTVIVLGLLLSMWENEDAEVGGLLAAAVGTISVVVEGLVLLWMWAL